MSPRGNIPGPLLTIIIAAQAIPSLSGLIFYIFLSIALLGGVMYIIGITLGIVSIVFVGQMTVVTAMFCLAPYIVQKLTKDKPKVIQRTFETLILALMFITFAYWLFSRNVFGVWIAYSVIIIAILNMGGYCIEHYQLNITNRIRNNTSLASLKVGVDIAEQTLGSSVFFYIAFPVGILVGIIVSLMHETRREEMIVLCIKITLILLCMTLLVLLVFSFIRMIKPLKKRVNEINIVTVQEGRENNILDNILQEGRENNIIGTIRTTIFESYDKFIRFVQGEQKQNLDEQNLSIAYVTTDLRKLYLFDAVHNSILFIALFVSFILLQNINLGLKSIMLGSLLISLIFNQIPYIIGQLLLHETILSHHEGVKRAEMAEKLKKIAPLFPTVDFLTAITTTGTAGGLMYFLLDKLIKDAFK